MSPTPEQLKEMWDWYQARKAQQLSYPVDDASKSAIGAVLVVGAGSTAKTQTYIDSNGDGHTGPKAYAQTVLILANGSQYEVPSLI